MEQPTIIYVQAHGGGSEKLDDKFISFNQYRKDKYKDKDSYTDPDSPYIIRILSPGKSALSDLESDDTTINFLVNMITDQKIRSKFRSLPNTRSFSGAYSTVNKGSRGQGELLKNASLFSSNDRLYNEILEVELDKKTGEINTVGGFGIFIHNGKERVLSTELSKLLVDGQQNEKNITILEIVDGIVKKLQTSNIIVIFPNCSPFSDVVYTDATNRSIWERIKVNQTYKKIVRPENQFKFALEIVARVKNFFEGQKRFSDFIEKKSSSPSKKKSHSSSQKKTSSSSEEKSSSSSQKKTSSPSEEKLSQSLDRIGIMDGEEFTLIFQLFFYFFKDYSNWLKISDKLRFSDIQYILSDKNIPEDLNVVKFIMALLLLVFRSHEKHGGIVYDIAEKKGDGKKEEIKEGRIYLWKKIKEQSTYGPIGRSENKRKDELFDQATIEQQALLDFIENINKIMEQKDPAIPRYTNFETLIQHAKNFATDPSKGGRRKKPFSKIPFSKKGKKNIRSKLKKTKRKRKLNIRSTKRKRKRKLNIRSTKRSRRKPKRKLNIRSTKRKPKRKLNIRSTKRSRKR